MEMDLAKINALCKSLKEYNLKSNKDLQFIRREDGHLGVTGGSYYSGEGVQGESDEYFDIYKIKSEKNLYIRVKTETDSYGDNEMPSGIEFVQATDKTVTEFKSIN